MIKKTFLVIFTRTVASNGTLGYFSFSISHYYSGNLIQLDNINLISTRCYYMVHVSSAPAIIPVKNLSLRLLYSQPETYDPQLPHHLPP